jgi:2,3-bisphosphoglycerate-independent phosphoglycerate mutase
MRELLSAFYLDNFDGFDRGAKPAINILTMTDYDASMPVPAMFPGESLARLFGEEISNAGLKQLRIAETEKYAHVTYFFNGGIEKPFEGEERILVPSPREVPTYDLKPQMSVEEVTARFEERFGSGEIDVAVMNFANPDMVGHTGVEPAAVAACRYVDNMVGRVVELADKMGAVLLVTADHGNSEQMWDYENNQPHTSHTTNPVWFVIHNYPCKINTSRGKLADIAPTMLKILGLPQPTEMGGECLI